MPTDAWIEKVQRLGWTQNERGIWNAPTGRLTRERAERERVPAVQPAVSTPAKTDLFNEVPSGCCDSGSKASKIRQRKNKEGESRSQVQNDPIVEPSVGDGALGTPQVQGGFNGRVLVRFTSYRQRLCDDDNLAAKAICDLLRYANVISGDDPTKAKIETRQFKVKKAEDEYNLIEVFEL